ncbi:MAG: sigma-70 family RNA polymerase sigma factor [Cystobacterineae bacterium]|nr:sigma-70 family RNA polymerase sigma factor [Cystobacterineae bacterium]
MATDDLTLIRRMKKGDLGAFRQLIERYQRKAYAVAFGMLKNREEALDVTQEAFIKIHKHMDCFKGDASFYTWLYRILFNLCVDVLRKHKGRALVDMELEEALNREEEEKGESPHGLLSSSLGTSPQKNVLQKELAQKLQEAMASLPEIYRAVLLMREIEGMSYEDLSKTLKIPKGTVMSRLFHARAKMQQQLAPYIKELP